MTLILNTNTVLQSMDFVNDSLMLTQTQDFQPIIDEVKRRREFYNGKLPKSNDGNILDVATFLLPVSLADLLRRSGIRVGGGDIEHYNFIIDWLKENFPCFLVFPNLNVKLGSGRKATPIKPIILDARDIKV